MPAARSSGVVPMIGIHPSPSSTIRRTLRGVSVPENSTGGPPGRTGLGSDHTCSNRTDSDANVAGESLHNARQAPMKSVRI